MDYSVNATNMTNHTAIDVDNADTSPLGVGFVIWLTVIALLAITAMFTNALVMATYWRERAVWKNITNLFILNLSIADFLIGMFNVPFYILLEAHGRWPLGEVACKLVLSLTYMFTYIPIIIIISLMAFRLILVRAPLHFRAAIKRKYIKGYLLGVWLVSFAFYSVLGFGFPIVTGGQVIDYEQLCYMEYHHNPHMGIFMICFEFFIPLTAMGSLSLALYCQIRHLTMAVKHDDNATNVDVRKRMFTISASVGRHGKPNNANMPENINKHPTGNQPSSPRGIGNENRPNDMSGPKPLNMLNASRSDRQSTSKSGDLDDNEPNTASLRRNEFIPRPACINESSIGSRRHELGGHIDEHWWESQRPDRVASTSGLRQVHQHPVQQEQEQLRTLPRRHKQKKQQQHQHKKNYQEQPEQQRQPHHHQQLFHHARHQQQDQEQHQHQNYLQDQHKQQRQRQPHSEQDEKEQQTKHRWEQHQDQQHHKRQQHYQEQPKRQRQQNPEQEEEEQQNQQRGRQQQNQEKHQHQNYLDFHEQHRKQRQQHQHPEQEEEEQQDEQQRKQKKDQELHQQHYDDHQVQQKQQRQQQQHPEQDEGEQQTRQRPQEDKDRQEQHNEQRLHQGQRQQHQHPQQQHQHQHQQQEVEQRGHQLPYHRRKMRLSMKDTLRRQANAVKMIFLLVAVFVLCWLPFHVVSVVLFICPSCVSGKILLAVSAGVLVNSCLNPFLYGAGIIQIRHGVQRLCHVPCTGVR